MKEQLEWVNESVGLICSEDIGESEKRKDFYVYRKYIQVLRQNSVIM